VRMKSRMDSRAAGASFVTAGSQGSGHGVGAGVGVGAGASVVVVVGGAATGTGSGMLEPPPQLARPIASRTVVPRARITGGA